MIYELTLHIKEKVLYNSSITKFFYSLILYLVFGKNCSLLQYVFGFHYRTFRSLSNLRIYPVFSLFIFDHPYSISSYVCHFSLCSCLLRVFFRFPEKEVLWQTRHEPLFISSFSFCPMHLFLSFSVIAISDSTPELTSWTEWAPLCYKDQNCIEYWCTDVKKLWFVSGFIHYITGPVLTYPHYWSTFYCW